MSKLSSLGALCSEMEASHMFILGSAYQEKNVHVGCAMVIIGDDEPFATGEEQK